MSIIKFINHSVLRMEASTLQKKKSSVSKGKLKRTLKNVLCRPDPVFWPVVSESIGHALEKALQKYRVQVPEFKKPHWSILKSISKEDRPKAPKIEKVKGLLFGVSTCMNAISSGDCDCIIIEAEVNPRILVQHVLESCKTNLVPVICLNGLKQLCRENFGIPTSCLGISKDVTFVPELRTTVVEISKKYNQPSKVTEVVESYTEMDCEAESVDELNSRIDNNNLESDTISTDNEAGLTPFKYLLRTSKKSRVFVPPTNNIEPVKEKRFAGQNFIEFSNKTETKTTVSSRKYMKMVVKRVTNNANRIKKKC